MAKLLLVDDDKDFLERLAEWLTLEGNEVDFVHCGSDALRKFDSAIYDVIILDWNLPDIEGVDLCKKYRDHGGSAYIIFLTGNGDVLHKEEGFDAGSDDYLVKPVNIRELSARIRRMLKRKEAKD